MASAAGTAGRMAALLALASLALTSCTEAPPLPPVVVLPPTVEAPPIPPIPGHKPSVIAKLPPQFPRETDAFERLHGLDQNETIALLGEPLQRADAPPAILWRYQSRHCELDVYFYLDLESREMRVLHYEVRDQNAGAEPAQRQCYRELVTERHDDPAGRTDRPRR
ncbi:MAG TPA: hypothetical protein VMU87_01995 [Stellaceae bacterium]|nr:hypothetical protein [Stellaceae bacterium]